MDRSLTRLSAQVGMQQCHGFLEGGPVKNQGAKTGEKPGIQRCRMGPPSYKLVYKP